MSYKTVLWVFFLVKTIHFVFPFKTVVQRDNRTGQLCTAFEYFHYRQYNLKGNMHTLAGKGICFDFVRFFDFCKWNKLFSNVQLKEWTSFRIHKI